MMPLNLANIGEETLILKVGGNPETRKHLADLGFVPGGTAMVVSAIGGNPALPSAMKWHAKS